MAMTLEILEAINSALWNRMVLWILLFAGLFFTFSLRFVQLRLFKEALKALAISRRSKDKQISSFQALCTSLAQRVGTGNLAGVATAITYGGEGSLFWMWVTAVIGAATAFAECTLAQVFKIRRADGTFYGGPAYYIHAGLRAKWLAVLFSILLIMAMGFIFNGVQSNTIAHGLLYAFDIDPLISGLLLAITCSLIIFGGMRRISQVSEILVPIMAFAYIGMTLIAMLLNLHEIPALLDRIIASAFNTDAAIGGISGHTIKEAFRFGVARGLFSNEAGFGSAPNAAATAEVEHPVQQGLVQMIAVFIDTLLICTSTGFLILLAKDSAAGQTGIALTQNAAIFHFGQIGKFFIGAAVILFGLTTIIGNAFYGEVNVRFLSNSGKVLLGYRLSVLAMVVVGALLEVPLVWQMADLMSATMIAINLTSIVLMANIIKKTARHFDIRFCEQKKSFSFSELGLVHNTHYLFAYDDHEAGRFLKRNGRSGA